jgi:hypothetical protein
MKVIMTDKGESLGLRGILVTAMAIIIFAVLTVGLIRGIGTLLVLSGGGGGAEYTVICDEYDGPLRVEWLISGNITGYDDIPENQKQNLSDDARKTLKSMNSYSSYDSINYTDMSSAQKQLFRESLNDGAVTENGSQTPPTRIIYRGKAYSCNTEKYVPGA